MEIFKTDENRRQQILTESGTNEVEIIEFMLGRQSFGINVAKVREIVSYDRSSVTAVPEAYHSVLGMLLLRENTLPLVDLKKHMSLPNYAAEDLRQVVLVCEFNKMVNGFLVDGVRQIHRCSWDQIIPLSPFLSYFKPGITSSITLDGQNVLMVDLEHIMVDIYPETKLVYSEEVVEDHNLDIAKRHHEREETHLIFAEDSPIVRQSVKKVTMQAGYNKITVFDNGEDTYHEIQKLADKARARGVGIGEYVTAVLTDIEMPRMDGLTLCRRIKEDLRLTHLPVIMFSSLINDQMINKCKSVGADGWADKLQVEELIHVLDKFCVEDR
ncbi:MAG: chemotaxis protein [Nitrospinota bacterium]|nr:chemotaxis protein [Nitrospinota bacterium]